MSQCDAIKIDIEKWTGNVCFFFCFCNFYLTTQRTKWTSRKCYFQWFFPCDWILMTFAIKNHSFIHGSTREGGGRVDRMPDLYKNLLTLSKLLIKQVFFCAEWSCFCWQFAGSEPFGVLWNETIFFFIFF